MLGAILPAIIGGAASLIGGKMNSDATSAMNSAVLADKEKDRELQRQFAQEGIRWKVEDARKAGVHPLYALGANTVSYSPSSVGLSADHGMGNAMASAGQDLSRAINATRTQSERDTAFDTTVKALTLEKAGLENQLLGAQIAKLRAGINPPMPALGDAGPIGEAKKYEDRPKLHLEGGPWSTSPRVSNAQDWQNRYGEPAEWAMAPYILWNDMKANYGRPPSVVQQRLDKSRRSNFWRMN